MKPSNYIKLGFLLLLINFIFAYCLYVYGMENMFNPIVSRTVDILGFGVIALFFTSIWLIFLGYLHIKGIMLKNFGRQIFYFVILVLLLTFTYGTIRYYQYKDILGRWVPVDKAQKEEYPNGYNFSYFGKYTLGDKKNLKCNLWNCTGYESGRYSIKAENGRRVIIMKITGTYKVNYEINNYGDSKILTLIDESSIAKTERNYIKR